MTQLELAKQGTISPQMEAVARQEGLEPELVRQSVEKGVVVIPANVNHRNLVPCGVGQGLRTKVNANIGTSSDFGNQFSELEKLRVAIDAGADSVMDLSTAGDITGIRRQILAASTVIIGTVPIYQAAVEAIERYEAVVKMTADGIFAAIEEQCRDGVDFITVHCGINRRNVEILAGAGRLCGVVSRGGSMTIEWMRRNRKENPLHEYYDDLLAMAREYGAALSVGDGLRPGALADATDAAQVAELLTIGELVQRARAAGVQAMVEGPGHVPLDQIEANVKLEKTVCNEAPFYLLGPLVTDVGCGYDHITGAIGGALAAWYGADFLCYVTPSEHLGLPTIEDVRQGVVASRIAAHAADVARHHPGAIDWDLKVSRARAALDWKAMISGCVDPQRADAVFSAGRSRTDGACTMCGEFCAIRRMTTQPKRARRSGRARTSRR